MRRTAASALVIGAAFGGACGDPAPVKLPDPAYAIGWDTTAWVDRRGGCARIGDGRRPRRGSLVEYGRYIVTLVDTTYRPPKQRRGRMWIGRSTPQGVTPAGPLVGAIDFPFSEFGISLADSINGAPSSRALDLMRPGLLVTHLNADHPEADPDYVLTIGTGANRRDTTVTDSLGVVLRIRALSGEWMWGTWGLRTDARSRRGYFCAALIDS
jgi:hypothetical protein